MNSEMMSLEMMNSELIKDGKCIGMMKADGHGRDRGSGTMDRTAAMEKICTDVSEMHIDGDGHSRK